MRQPICPECGGPVVIKKYRHVENVGGVKVNDETAIRPYCTHCGNVDLTLSELAGYERRAAALVLDKVSRANGAMLRYARKALGITQAELAKLIGHEPETISRWETDKRPIERAEQLALVALLDQVECHGLDIRERLQQEADGRDKAAPTELEVPVKREAA
jgi:putative zinc finger/helix-turn-helix YgiT family protein